MTIKSLYPPDVTGDAIHPMHLKVMSSYAELSKDFDIEIIGRMPEEAFRKVSGLDTKYRNFFESDIFSKDLSEIEVEQAEGYLGAPFNYLAFSTQRRWGWLNRRDVQKKVARYIYAWKEAFKDTDILLNFMDSLFFINTAELVADRMGIRNIKVIRGRLINDSLIFWDKNNMPIYYKTEYDSAVLEKFRARATQVKEIVKIDKGAVNKFENVAKKIPLIPKKISALTGGGIEKLDADVPRLMPKYKQLLLTSLRHLVYPRIHAIFFDKSRKGERYFLYSIHYEWEAQIAYREPFLNQLKTAKQIAKCLPHNTYLYVKVHPHWKNADQDISAVYDLKKERNVRLIRPEENTTELIRNAMGVIVINSTVGYEALLLGKPLVVLGHEAYREIGIDIKDINDLPKVLSSIKNREYKADIGAYEQFLRRYAGNIIGMQDVKEIAAELKTVINWSMEKRVDV